MLSNIIVIGNIVFKRYVILRYQFSAKKHYERNTMKKPTEFFILMLFFFTPFMSACASDNPQTQQNNVKDRQTSDKVGAANADVVFVKARETRPGVWTFAVSVSHPDTGWNDYANGWDVVLEDGSVIKNDAEKFTRVLAHPHVGQSPFTRSQSGLKIASTVVTVRAHDMLDGFGGQEIIVDLSMPEGPGFTVRHR